MYGINIIADLTAGRGLTEAARTTIQAIQCAGIPTSFIEENYQGFPDDERDSSTGISFPQHGSGYPLNLMFCGITNFSHLDDAKLASLTAGKYTIAYWVWEFSTMPESYRLQFERVDEIWTASQFCTQSMLDMANGKPIRIIPHPISLSGARNRALFGLPEDRMIFLFIFDAAGSAPRKNPEAVIDAFQLAFGKPDDSGPLLVMRARHINNRPAYKQRLLQKLDVVGGVLLDQDYTREEVNALLVSADACVSLHRAEGFGLTMAEAMALGKPVIATKYSGNVDYMTPDNSYLVDYRLRPVEPAEHADQPFFADLYAGREWADASITEAAYWMKHVATSPQEAAQRGQRAAEDMQRLNSLTAVGELIRTRIEQIIASQK
jgi:glycosyltransferase involved in cell wall biosynthesis